MVWIIRSVPSIFVPQQSTGRFNFPIPVILPVLHVALLGAHAQGVIGITVDSAQWLQIVLDVHLSAGTRPAYILGTTIRCALLDMKSSRVTAWTAASNDDWHLSHGGGFVDGFELSFVAPRKF
jgi:hypothetical protein